MKFISVQPDSDFYIWQLQVQQHNFKKLSIDKDSVILFGYKESINPNAIEFAESTEAKVYFIKDTRESPKYIPSLRPHILKKYWSGNTITESVFYHDADMIFTESLPDFDSMNQSKLYVSDTQSYIGARYIRSKGEGLLNRMCETIGIQPELVTANEEKSGGAQYYFNFPLTSDYWSKVERDSENLYQLMVETSSIYNPKHPIQAWTSDMWAVLWNVWLSGYDSEINKDLSFAWATEPIRCWDNHKIFHNAGVTGHRSELFYKGAYMMISPFDQDFTHISDNYCSYKYVQAIKETGSVLKR